MSELVRIEGLCKSFFLEGKEIQVLKGIDMTIGQAEMISIAGASGVGKSTFLHVLGTLDSPTAGQVIFDEKDVFRFSEPELAAFRNRSIGFVFQFHHLLPDFTALENTMMPALISSLPRREVQARAQELLEEVGLAERMNHRPGELSGGEQQRVALARALIMRPRLILADEPTGNLDRRNGEEVHRLLTSLNLSHGVTTVVVTHNPDLAARMPRQLKMVDGTIIESQ